MLNNETTLRIIIDDPSTLDVERAEALRELDAYRAESETAADTRLENELLYEYHAASLGDVQCVNLHEFCAVRRFSADTYKLFFKWLSVAPAAQQKLRQMRKHLENFFLASYDSMLRRYKEALEGGGDLNAADREALKFYRNWADSVVVPEEMKPHFCELISALSARCEGQHANQK